MGPWNHAVDLTFTNDGTEGVSKRERDHFASRNTLGKKSKLMNYETSPHTPLTWNYFSHINHLPQCILQLDWPQKVESSDILLGY